MYLAFSDFLAPCDVIGLQGEGSVCTGHRAEIDVEGRSGAAALCFFEGCCARKLPLLAAPAFLQQF